jgi:hypothetical protein
MVQCGEPCTVAASAKVKTARTSAGLGSKRVKRALPAGANTKLRLRFAGRSLRAIRRALARHRKAFAKVTVLASDAAGNQSTARYTIRLKR